MVKHWNETEKLKNRLRFLGNPETLPLSDMLEEANRRVKTLFGHRVEETLKIRNTEQQKFFFSFPDIHRFIKAELNDQEIDASNYTIELGEQKDEEAYIEFTSDYATNNLDQTYMNLIVEYVPLVFVDMELQLAIEEVLTWSSIQTNEENETVRLENAKKRVNELSKEIKSRMPPKNRARGRFVSGNYWPYWTYYGMK